MFGSDRVRSRGATSELPGRRAFTLLEVMIVITVMAILAISIVPAMSSARGAQGAGAAREVERMLFLARARAMATSVSHAVRVRTSPSSLQLCRREPLLGGIEAAVADDGQPWPEQPLSARFGNVRITHVEVDGMASESALVWFAFNGALETRQHDGTRVGNATHDAVVTLSDGSVVTVVARTGAVTIDFGGTP